VGIKVAAREIYKYGIGECLIFYVEYLRLECGLSRYFACC